MGLKRKASELLIATLATTGTANLPARADIPPSPPPVKQRAFPKLPKNFVPENNPVPQKSVGVAGEKTLAQRALEEAGKAVSDAENEHKTPTELRTLRKLARRDAKLFAKAEKMGRDKGYLGIYHDCLAGKPVPVIAASASGMLPEPDIAQREGPKLLLRNIGRNNPFVENDPESDLQQVCSDAATATTSFFVNKKDSEKNTPPGHAR